MKSTGEMSREVSVGLEMGRQRRKRGLIVCAAAIPRGSHGWEIQGHGRGGSVERNSTLQSEYSSQRCGNFTRNVRFERLNGHGAEELGKKVDGSWYRN